MPALGDRRPALGLGRRRGLERRLEPGPDGGPERGERIGLGRDHGTAESTPTSTFRPDGVEVASRSGAVRRGWRRRVPGGPRSRPWPGAALALWANVERGEARILDGPPRGVDGRAIASLGVKKIGFLSFGHWSEAPYSQVRNGSDALLQSIELAVAAEELGADGAYFRVHHFARQLASPFPLLAAIGARTTRIEIGTAVIDMRYENPLYMVEDAGAADLIAGGRLQLGISRGSPEQVIDGFRYFGYAPAEGETDADMARQHAEVFLQVLKGEGFAEPNPRPMFPNPPGLLRPEPHSDGSPRPDLVGRRHRRHRRLGREARHEPAELDAQVRRERRAAPRPAAQADRGVPGRVEGGRSRARAARVGQPQHLRPGRRPGPRLLRARVRTTRTRSAISIPRPARSSAGRTRRSPTFSSRSSPRTRRSPPPTPCC